MASKETESLTESCSDTRKERGSEDRVSETESISTESVDSQKPAEKFRSDVCPGATLKRMQMERKCDADYVNTNMPTSEQRVT